MMSENIRVYLRSLGCAKNLVDSEMMSGLLLAHNFQFAEQPQDADVIIVNTCGFIQSAQVEAIDNILELAQYKEIGRCRLLLAVGCMVEKFRQEMRQSMPEIDAFLGTSEYDKIAVLIEEKLALLPQNPCLPQDPYLLRSLSTPPYLAYLKVAEGCDNHCAYCMIPQLRGAYKSRPVSDIVAEAESLYKRGVKELILLAQDLTNYGQDIYGHPALAELVDRIADIPFVWIRLLYLYPTSIDEELLQVMVGHDNICHYLDIPLQHADDDVLQAMNRRGNCTEIKEKIRLIRSYLPDIALRTTMMVGFPGETKSAFANLLQFLQEMKFDWVGVFKYCRAADTAASKLPHQVHEDAKMRREEKAMSLLAQLTPQSLSRHIGTELLVVTEQEVEGRPGWYQGRSQYHAPEVDGSIYFTAQGLKAGDFVKVKITGCDIYDLIGEKI
jgi:ribosomal protein S12 methylthiotransferase